MFKNHSFNPLVGFVIAALAVLSIGTAIYSQQDPSSTADSRVGALDWYFNHDHAVLDGDNNVVSGVNVPGNSSPLDWYFDNPHAIIDGDNNVVPSGATNASAEQDKRMVMQELEREKIDQLNANSVAVPASMAWITERYSALKDKQLEQFDTVVPAVTVPSAPTSFERYMNLKDAQLGK